MEEEEESQRSSLGACRDLIMRGMCQVGVLTVTVVVLVLLNQNQIKILLRVITILVVLAKLLLQNHTRR